MATLDHKLTIVIPTFNRHVYLLRLLNYYESQGFPFAVRILDSSKDQALPAELQKFLNNPNVTYQKFDSAVFFVHKIAQGLKGVQTPFSALCADDDFLVPPGVEACLEFLSRNPDYSCCHGRYILHQINTVGGKDRLFWMPNYIHAVSVEHETARGRFEDFFPGHYAGYPMYAVHRTETHQKIWEEADRTVSDWGLSEMFPSCASIIAGKMKIIDCFYAARETNLFEWVTPEARQRMYTQEKVNKVIIQIAEDIDAKDRLAAGTSLGRIKEKVVNFLRDREIKFTKAPQPKTGLRLILKTHLGPAKEDWIRLRWLVRIGNIPGFLKELKDIRKYLFLFKMDREAVKNFRAAYNNGDAGTLAKSEI